MEKYVKLAKELHAENALIISPAQISFDVRAIFKCKWGCEEYAPDSIRCSTRGTTSQERMEMVQRYSHILLVHGHDAGELSRIVLDIEHAAFFDGYYFAFAVRTCRLCKDCKVLKGRACVHPEKGTPLRFQFRDRYV